MWTCGETTNGTYYDYSRSWTHSGSGLVVKHHVFHRYHRIVSRVTFPQHHPSTPDERQAVADAIDTHLEPIRVERKAAEAQRARAEELAKTAHIRAPFEKMGCPPNPSDSSIV
jgi:hypothetical protein